MKFSNVTFQSLWDNPVLVEFRGTDFEDQPYLSFLPFPSEFVDRKFTKFLSKKLFLDKTCTAIECEKFEELLLTHIEVGKIYAESNEAIAVNLIYDGDEFLNDYKPYSESWWFERSGAFFYFDEDGGLDPHDMFGDSIPEGIWNIEGIRASYTKDYFGEVDAEYFFESMRPATPEEIARVFETSFWDSE